LRRRGRLDIINDILSIATDGAGKTAIVYHANLNFNRADVYIDLLLREGLLDLVDGPVVRYRTTEKGLEFLRAYRELRQVLEDSSGK
jgi:predicted transcriptional regulator